MQLRKRASTPGRYAASAIASAQILLNSRSEAFPNGLAGLDYLGAVSGGPSPLVVATWSAVLLAAVFTVAAARRTLR